MKYHITYNNWKYWIFSELGMWIVSSVIQRCSFSVPKKSAKEISIPYWFELCQINIWFGMNKTIFEIGWTTNCVSKPRTTSVCQIQQAIIRLEIFHVIPDVVNKFIINALLYQIKCEMIDMIFLLILSAIIKWSSVYVLSLSRNILR